MKAMTNSEKQKKHRYYRRLAVKLMEKQLHVKTTDIMNVLKWHDMQNGNVDIWRKKNGI